MGVGKRMLPWVVQAPESNFGLRCLGTLRAVVRKKLAKVRILVSTDMRALPYPKNSQHRCQYILNSSTDLTSQSRDVTLIESWQDLPQPS
jgi:hypothetical protein